MTFAHGFSKFRAGGNLAALLVRERQVRGNWITERHVETVYKCWCDSLWCWVRAGLWLVVVCFVAACRRGSDAPATGGVRIAAHSPAAAVIIRDLGHSDLCVARHGYDMVLPKSLPVVGSQEGFDYEALIGVRPTHIITQWGSHELPATLRTLAESNHWTLLDTRLLSLEDIRRDALAIDALICGALHMPTPSPRAKELLAEMDRAWSPRAGGFAGAGRVLLLVSVNPPAAFGPGSCHQQILEAIGAVPAITSGNAFIEMDAESLLRLAPDTIVLVSPRSFDGPARDEAARQARVAEAFAKIATLAIPAAQHHQLGLIDDPLSQLPSTSMIQLADDMAEVLRGVH